MATAGESAQPGEDDAQDLLAANVPALTGIERARVTLTIDIGTLTPETVKAIAEFVSALADDPAKSVSSGPKPAAASKPAPGGGGQG